MNESITSRRLIAPSPYTSRIVDRPETLSFPQPDPIRLSPIGKASPIPSPSSESPAVQDEANVESTRLPLEELVTASAKPIEILENTISKYDSLIDQIASVLASVSPMSSTVSSLSPGKSAMDYQLSSDSSPILPHRRTEQPIPTPVQHAAEPQRNQTKHLIREDSYDKIVTAISDLDSELVASSNNEMLSDGLTDIREETKTPTIDEDKKDERIELETSVVEVDQIPAVAAVEDEIITASDHVATEIQPESTAEAVLPATDANQQPDGTYDEETDDMASKRAGKRVTWDESIVDNEEEDGSVTEALTQAAPYEMEEQLTDVAEEETSIIIASPIDSLPESVSNRYTSSDVYHGYLGDHQQFSLVSSRPSCQIYRPGRACFLLVSKDASDEESMKKALFASLRETISAPIAPLIESIQSVVSNMQTTGDHSLESENLVHEQEPQLEASSGEVRFDRLNTRRKTCSIASGSSRPRAG